MGAARDYETRQAVLVKWNASTSCKDAAPGGIFEGPKPEPRPATTYVIVASKPDGRPNQRSTGNGAGTDNEIDYRRLTFVVYGLAEADVVTAVEAIDATFGDRRDTFPANALAINGATWMRTEPIAEAPDLIERAERTEAGQWWKATLAYRVHSSRNH